MTEREELFLYQGVLIGIASTGGQPHGRIVSFLNEAAIKFRDNEKRHSLDLEIQHAVEDAERRLAAKN